MAFQFIIFAKDDNAKKCIEDKQDICGYGVQRLELLTHFLREYCDFVVWSEKGGTLVERVSADINFF